MQIFPKKTSSSRRGMALNLQTYFLVWTERRVISIHGSLLTSLCYRRGYSNGIRNWRWRERKGEMRGEEG